MRRSAAVVRLATYPEDHAVIVVTSNSGERSAGVPVSHKIAEDLAELVFARQAAM